MLLVLAALVVLALSANASAISSLRVSSNESASLGARPGLREVGWSPVWIVGLKGWWTANAGVTVATATSALIVSDGSNLVKLMVGT